MSEEYDLLEKYPNQQLSEVVCEIRFPNKLEIECHRDLFYNKVKDAYPSIIAPKPTLKPGQEITFTPYRFDNEEGTAGVMLSLNKFSYFEKEYRGHKKFIEEFMRLANILSELYVLGKLNRVGWRYINVIPFVREEGIVPLQNFLDIEINAKPITNRFENISLVFTSRVEDGSITTRIEPIIRTNDKQEALLLDFDFAMAQDLDFSKLGTYVDNAHSHTRTLFEGFITDSYRKFLRGGGEVI